MPEADDEFDANFRRQLLIVLAQRNQVGACNDQSSCSKSFASLHEFTRRLGRLIIGWLCDFAGIDLVVKFSWLKPRALTCKQAIRQFVHERSRRTKTLWPHVLLGAYLLMCAYLLVNIYFHYIYNANNLKLKHLELMRNLTRVSQAQINELELEFKRRASQALETLHLIGNTHPNWPFVIQSITILFILANLQAYLLTPAHYIINGWPLLAPLAILDANLERAAQIELILDQLRKCSHGGRLLAVSRLGQVGGHLAQVVSSRPRSLGTADKLLERTSEQLERRHTNLIRRLKLLALNGRLLPLNRTGLQLDRLSLILLASVIISEIYLQILVFGGRHALRLYFMSLGIYDRYETIQDYAYELCIILVLQFMAHSITLFGAIFCVSLYDLMEAVRLLRQLICDTIHRNSLRVERLMVVASGKAHSGGQHYGRNNRLLEASFKGAIERDLLVVLIECRMVKKNIELAKAPLSFLSSTAIWLSAITLVVSRLHNPYLDPALRPMSLVLSIVCVVGSLIFLTPTSRLHQRATKSFEMLWPLVAQLSHFETMPRIGQLLEPNSSLAIVSLRRELADTRAQMQRLACEIWSLPLTSQNLTKIVFWALLIMISISSNVNLGGEGLSRLAEDPFGLYDLIGPH